MDRAQLRRRAHVRLALIAHDVVGHAEPFQQPQHALRVGIVEMMDGEHGVSPVRTLEATLVAAKTGVGDWPFCLYFAPGDIDMKIIAVPGQAISATASSSPPRAIAPTVDLASVNR